MINFSNVSTLYVSQKYGDNLFSGFKPQANGFGDGPVKTLEYALYLVSELRTTGHMLPISIQIIDDEYYLEKPIVIGADSIEKIFANPCGMNDVTIEPFRNRKVKIIGGKLITGFQRENINGIDCFCTYIPEVKSGEWIFSDLYVDGVRADFTRYPEDGFLRAVTTENPQYGEGNTRLFYNSKWFIAKKEDLENITFTKDSIVSFYHYWIDEHSPIDSYDKETGKLVLKYPTRFNITCRYEPPAASDIEYYIENIPEMLKKPNQWYIDRNSGKLYYIPRTKKQTTENIVVYAPVVEKFFSVKGTSEDKISNIRFRNIEFICTRGDYSSKIKYIDGIRQYDEVGFAADTQSCAYSFGAIEFENAHCCTVENCEIKNVGLHAISVEQGCDGIRIENCRIYDAGAGGIKIFGGSATETPFSDTHHNIVRNCDISFCGKRYAAGCGILANDTYCNEFSDNTISYLCYSGISVGWVWGFADNIAHDNIIRGNHIHHIGNGNLSDMGGVYLLGKQHGTIVEKNIIHDVVSKHYGGWGIYTDEGSSFITVENNIVYNTSSNCYHQHYGSYNVVRNNIFAFGKEGIIRYSKRGACMGILFERNILVTNGEPVYGLEDHSLFMNWCILAHSNMIYDISGKEPVMFEGGGRKIYLDEFREIFGIEEYTIIKDPLFTDIDNYDFSLKDNSPAFLMGFKEI